MKNKVSELNILYHKSIKVVGVTFESHPKNINKIIENGIYYRMFKKYKGQKDKEILKENKNVIEFNNEELSDCILEQYKYNDEDAIKVLINDFDDEYLEVGNIPKEEVPSLLPYLNNKHNLIINAYLTGGNLKTVKASNKKDYISTEELNIGISLDIIVKEK